MRNFREITHHSNSPFSYRVISVNNEVNGFMLDPAIGEFVLTDPNMKIPKRGKIYSINEGYEKKWEPAIYEYVKSKKEGKKPYGARYIGSMVTFDPKI